VLILREEGELSTLETKWWYDKGECGNKKSSSVKVSLPMQVLLRLLPVAFFTATRHHQLAQAFERRWNLLHSNSRTRVSSCHGVHGVSVQIANRSPPPKSIIHPNTLYVSHFLSLQTSFSNAIRSKAKLSITGRPEQQTAAVRYVHNDRDAL
jgi:hypothetical protein